MNARALGAVLTLAVVAGCGERQPPPPPEAGAPAGTQPAFEPPVVTNGESPVRYPAAAFQQNMEGTVILRLFVDSAGRLFPESTRVAEGSGVASLDSAALAGVRDMKFAPARRSGRSVGTAFLQPVQFRRRDRNAPGAQ